VKPSYTVKFSMFSVHNAQQFAFNYIRQAHEGDPQKQQRLREAWGNMRVRLTEHFQTPAEQQWVWGSFHRDRMLHLPFGLHPLLSRLYNLEAPGWGNLHTANVGKCNKHELGDFSTSHRANFRHIFDLGSQSEWVIDGGAS
jgi:hypothetical protein